MEEYSTFNLEGIYENVKGYQKLCDMFLALAKDEGTKVKLESILYKGGYKDYGMCSKIECRDDPAIEAQRRTTMAELLIRNPETFDSLCKHKINIFHGSNANALPSILKYGLMSIDESVENGVTVTTGEEWSRRNSGRSFISVTDDLQVAKGYSTIEADEKEGKLSFGIIVGTSTEDIRKCGIRRIHSDVPEIGLTKKISPENIKSVMVPSEKVDIVKKMVGEQDIEVLPFDGVNDNFYWIDEYGYLSISEDRYNNLKNRVSSEKPKTFGLDEIKSLTERLKLSSIKERLTGIYQKVTMGKEEGYSGREV